MNTKSYDYTIKSDKIYRIDGKVASKKDLNEIIFNIVNDVVKHNKPHIFKDEKVPFNNLYTGGLSFDYSGRVELANVQTILDLEDNVKDLNLGVYENYYTSKLAKVLDHLRTGQSQATYISNYGLHWTTYIDEIEDVIKDWITEITVFPDEDDSNYDDCIDMIDTLMIGLKQILCGVLKEADYETILDKVYKSTM